MYNAGETYLIPSKNQTHKHTFMYYNVCMYEETTTKRTHTHSHTQTCRVESKLCHMPQYVTTPVTTERIEGISIWIVYMYCGLRGCLQSYPCTRVSCVFRANRRWTFTLLHVESDRKERTTSLRENITLSTAAQRERADTRQSLSFFPQQNNGTLTTAQRRNCHVLFRNVFRHYVFSSERHCYSFESRMLALSGCLTKHIRANALGHTLSLACEGACTRVFSVCSRNWVEFTANENALGLP